VSTTEVLVIGAGPFGLSISAYLRGLGVDHVIAGRPMDTWRAHMPIGMTMKSEPYASVIASPKRGYDVATYCRTHGFYYVDRVGPVSLERFLGYADWYTEQLVPDVRDLTATEITQDGDRFRVAFAEADSITARQVVIATGVLPYSHIPDELSGLPSDLVSHVKEHHDLERFQGRRVAVVGAGQSALETATLLHELGVDVRVIARTQQLKWNEINPAHLGPVGRIKRPVTQLCEGWRCRFWYTPMAFRQLPLDYRITKARTVLGPAGAWWLQDRFVGKVDVLTGHHVRKAVADGSGVQLLVEGPDQSALNVDHVIAGTGYRIDLARLPFLPERLRARIATISRYPAVSRVGESSVPNLYFVGAPTAASIGPSARFIAGTHTVSALLAHRLANRARAGKIRAAALPGGRADRPANRGR
jgi:FAD-dependent urate hydroxylase